MSITIELSHEIQTFKDLQEEWTELQTRSATTRIELSWQWVYIFYKHNIELGELWLMAAHEDNRLIGIAPLIKVKEKPSRGFAWQKLEFIGTFNDEEHLDFVIETGYEERVIPLFIDKLYEHRSRWDVINLTRLADTKTIDILEQSDRDWFEYHKDNVIAPYMTLPDTVEEWEQSLSSKRRWSIRRDYKRLEEQFPDRWSITTVTQPDELDETFDELVHLNQILWEARGEPGNFNYGKFTECYRELAHSLLENGWLRMYRLNIDSKPCAIDFCCHYLGQANGHITGTNREVTNVAIGILLKHHGIKQAILEGCDEFTFGEVGMSYKHSLGGVDREHRAFRLIGSPRVKLQLKTRTFLRGVKSGLRQMKSKLSETATDEVSEG